MKQKIPPPPYHVTVFIWDTVHAFENICGILETKCSQYYFGKKLGCHRR